MQIYIKGEKSHGYKIFHKLVYRHLDGKGGGSGLLGCESYREYMLTKKQGIISKKKLFNIIEYFTPQNKSDPF